MPIRNQVFISYSHADAKHFKRLKVHLKPYEDRFHLNVWDDNKIKVGDQWRQEIRDALDRACVAVMLISPDFLASDFIAKNELPPLLKGAQQNGVKIFPVILQHSAYESIPELKVYQALNPLSKPVVSMHSAYREKLWAQLAKLINDAPDLAKENVPQTILPTEIELYGDSRDFISFEIAHPERIDEYFVYSYEHIDSNDFMPLAKDIFSNVENFDQILVKIKNRLIQSGWEGDGDIRILWLPPFANLEVEDTFGVTLWHVKQRNNGTSWIASPIPLKFSSLAKVMPKEYSATRKQGGQKDQKGGADYSNTILNLAEKEFFIGNRAFSLKDVFSYLGKSLAAGATKDSLIFELNEFTAYDDRINVFSISHSISEITGPLVIMGLVEIHPPTGDWGEMHYLTEKGKDVLNKIGGWT